MSTTLLKMVATLMCALAACTEVKPVADFSLERMSGKWYSVGFATNAQWFANYTAEMKMGTVIFEPRGEDLDISISSLKENGSCWRASHHANKTDTPGRFTFHSQKWNDDNDMTIVDVDYDKHALIHTIKTKQNGSEVISNLYSRTTNVSAVQQERFQQFSQEIGVLPDNIVMLPINAGCQEPDPKPDPKPEPEPDLKPQPKPQPKPEPEA